MIPTLPSSIVPKTRTRFPRLRAWLARLPLTREGLFWFVIASVLLLVGLLKAINLVTLLASLLVVLVLWNWWAARRQLRPVHAQNWEEEPPFAQTPFQAAVRLHNRGQRPIGGLEVFTGAGPLRPRWFVSELAAGADVVLQAEVTYPRRGRVDGEALTVASGYPLGLVRLQHRCEPQLPRVVLPRLGRLHRAQLRRFLSRHSPQLGQTRSLPSPSPMAQTEFHGLRPYRPGDSPRHVHWRTSARRGELMVREYEDWPNDDLTVILEARRDPAADEDADADADARLELAIRLTATVCWDWCRQTGDRLVFVVAGTAVTIQDGVTDRALARTLLERLALEPGAAVIDTSQLAARLQERRLPVGPILVISPSESDLALRLQQQLRRRVAAVVAGSGEAAAFFED
jgi:uncharacterized protein (DUF58 family)